MNHAGSPLHLWARTVIRRTGNNKMYQGKDVRQRTADGVKPIGS